MKLESLAYYAQGILQKDRIVLSKAITLIESTVEEHQKIAHQLIDFCVQLKRKSKIIGISGAPGVGKSTFINSLGKYLVEQENQLAILAIDPSSSISKGSILGDKTRMIDLAQNDNVYIRPSANGEYLGGIARKTYETILLCEAFGFNYILVETVGVGQSEIEVKHLVDIFILLLLPNAGDELQGIKRGIMELANIIVINKSDQENLDKAKISVSQLKSILPLLYQENKNWKTQILTASAIENQNIDKVFKLITTYFGSISIEENRLEQQFYWKNKMIQEIILQKIKCNPILDKLIQKTLHEEQYIYANLENIIQQLNKML